MLQSAAYRLRYGEPDLPIDWITEHNGDEPRSMPHWCTAELQRIAAPQLLATGGREGARTQLEFARDTAMHQGAIAWQIRAVRSLARLDLAEGRRQDEANRLSSPIKGVIEGGKTRDVRRAHELLELSNG